MNEVPMMMTDIGEAALALLQLSDCHWIRVGLSGGGAWGNSLPLPRSKVLMKLHRSFSNNA
eukprot:CAMPEP_0176426392 /NCGR_PEP_ID=MMETSP0127-20121128/11915_1 /TAXON_ID=938130 /ORGANISM="Platyophrya macrostoma, Strain WH" /LENGTH=60 /DNA_ID=CAMNT_0017807651 /DNA_START=49 /DNA_END=231 /DNA_ORIENTATION=+